jgi:hypothetical protein
MTSGVSTERRVDWVAGCLTGWLSDWLTHWLIDWLTNRVADWLTVRPAAWLNGWLAEWLSGWLTERISNWLTGWLTGWMAVWLKHWLTDWLSHCLCDIPVAHPNLRTQRHYSVSNRRRLSAIFHNNVTDMKDIWQASRDIPVAVSRHTAHQQYAPLLAT